jgi:twitching motility protein PilT
MTGMAPFTSFRVTRGGGKRMEKIIKAAVERGASDLHIKAGDVFRARINGKLVALTKQRLTPDQTRAIAMKLISSDEDRARIERLRDFDCSWGMPGVGRFRVNVLRQRSSFMIVMRVIPFTVPTIESLRLPDVLGQIAESERGLVLVTGVSGSGKSSTMAAMIHHVNRTQHKHVVTIENPIEFLHRDLSCSITQREVGVDTESIAVGLRAALRQDPDVVVIGEMADTDTIDTTIKAAETGHLVFATMPTADVVATIERVVASLPAHEREVGRMRFAETLRAVVSQQLLPEKNEKARVPAVEVMVMTPAIRDIIREGGRTADVLKHMDDDRKQLGSQTYRHHLQDLVQAGLISPDSAKAAHALTKPSAPAKRGGKHAAAG